MVHGRVVCMLRSRGQRDAAWHAARVCQSGYVHTLARTPCVRTPVHGPQVALPRQRGAAWHRERTLARTPGQQFQTARKPVCPPGDGLHAATAGQGDRHRAVPCHAQTPVEIQQTTYLTRPLPRQPRPRRRLRMAVGRRLLILLAILWEGTVREHCRRRNNPHVVLHSCLFAFRRFLHLRGRSPSVFRLCGSNTPRSRRSFRGSVCMDGRYRHVAYVSSRTGCSGGRGPREHV